MSDPFFWTIVLNRNFLSFEQLYWQKHLLIRLVDATRVAWKVFWTQDLKLIPFLSNSGLPPFASLPCIIKFMYLGDKSVECVTAALFTSWRAWFSAPSSGYHCPSPWLWERCHWDLQGGNLVLYELSRNPVAISERKSQGNLKGGSLGPTDQWNTFLSIKTFRDLTLYPALCSMLRGIQER